MSEFKLTSTSKLETFESATVAKRNRNKTQALTNIFEARQYIHGGSSMLCIHFIGPYLANDK